MLVQDFISYLNIIGTAPGDETDLVIADPEQERPESIFNGRCASSMEGAFFTSRSLIPVRF